MPTTLPLKFGMLHLFENAHGRPYPEAVREAQDLMIAAEEYGFNSIWPAEHHFTEYGCLGNNSVNLAHVAAKTKNLRLGTGIVVLPFHNPVRVAEEYAMLDCLSDGRVELGVGRGYQPKEFTGMGLDQSQSRGMFLESMEIIRQAWTQDTVNFTGEFYEYHDIEVLPRPQQSPHPPIWMASLSKETFEIVGKYGYNLLCSVAFGFTGDMAEQAVKNYHAALESGGHTPDEKQIGALCMVYCADSMEEAMRDFADPIMWYMRCFGKYVSAPDGAKGIPGYEWYGGLRDMANSVNFDTLVKFGAVICGTPDHVHERIHAMVEKYGITEFLCWTRLGGMDPAKVRKSMKLMEDKVIPKFQQ